MHSNFSTINAVHREYGFSVHFLRQLLRAGQLPGYYAGTRFYINVPRLLAAVDSAQSRGQEAGNE